MGSEMCIRDRADRTESLVAVYCVRGDGVDGSSWHVPSGPHMLNSRGMAMLCEIIAVKAKNEMTPTGSNGPHRCA